MNRVPCGNDAELDLPRQRVLAHPIPPAVELPAVARRVLGRHVVRGMRGTGREVHVEGLVRRHRLLESRPGDRLVGHVRGEVIAGIPLVLHADDAVVDGRRPLVRLTADEPVELVEARPRGPAVVGSGHRHLPGRGLVVLPERRGAEAVQPQDLGQGRHAVGPDARVAGERGGQLHDGAGVVDVMIAARQQGGSRGRAEGGRVEAVEFQAVGRQFLERRHVHRSAERARRAEPDVVDEHHHHVRGTSRGRHFVTCRRDGLARVDLGDGGNWRLRHRQHRAIDRARWGRAWRRWWRWGCLGTAGQGQQAEYDSSCDVVHSILPLGRAVGSLTGMSGRCCSTSAVTFWLCPPMPSDGLRTLSAAVIESRWRRAPSTTVPSRGGRRTPRIPPDSWPETRRRSRASPSPR